MSSINQEYSKKSYVVAVCLVGIFGTLGFHHFYVNRWLHGLFDLSLAVLTVACFVFAAHGDLEGRNDTWLWLCGGLLYLVDCIHTVYFMYKLIIGEYMDGKGKPISYRKA